MTEILVSYVVRTETGERTESRIVRPSFTLSGDTILLLEQQIQASETGEVRVIGFTQLERQLSGREVMALVSAIKSEIPDIDAGKLLDALETWVTA